MGALGGSGPCGRAEAYYYDVLDDPDGGNVPPSVMDHIQTCQYCRKRIRRLEQMLSETGPGAQFQQNLSDKKLISELQHHFEYLGRRVECRDVKPFLPGLLASSLRLKVPTPISSHIDRCLECAQDLRVLNGLGLDPEQLDRLRGLYGSSFEPDPQMCEKARAEIATFGSGVLTGIGADVLDHLSLCSKCRNQVYRYRKTMHRPDDHDCPGNLSRDGITMTEIFDYVVPYGRGSKPNDTNRVCQGHIQSCPECLEMIQLLHRTIYAIADRADSEVGTIYSVDTDDRKVNESRDDDSEGSVSIVEEHPVADMPVVRVVSEKRKGFFRSPLKSYVKVAFLAAAVIPVAIIFHLSAPLATGFTIRQSRSALAAGTKNVHVRVFEYDEAAAWRQVWYGAGGKIVIDEVENTSTIYDLVAEEVVIVDRVKRTQNTVSLDNTIRDNLAKNVPTLFYPSLDSTDNLLDTEAPIMPPEPGGGDSSAVVRVLKWEDQGGRKCRLEIHVEPKNELPERTLFFREKPFRRSTRSLGDDTANDDMEERREFEYYSSSAEILRRVQELRAIGQSGSI